VVTDERAPIAGAEPPPMSTTSATRPAAGAGTALGGALLWQGEGDAEPRAYPLFDGIAAVDGGIFLAGGYFLEIGEEATIELHLPDGAVRARIQVTEVRGGDQPGMVAALVDTDEATRERIRAAAGTAG
jgi:hypothetical protein